MEGTVNSIAFSKKKKKRNHARIAVGRTSALWGDSRPGSPSVYEDK